MNRDGPVRLMLGPQRPIQNLAEAIAAAGLPGGPIATISAGWQEAENDIDDVREVVGRPLEDLRLHHRAETVFQANQKLAEGYRMRQNRLKEQQRLYGLRLRQLAIAARQMLDAEGDHDTIVAERRHAIAQLRALDRHHLHRTELPHKSFAREFNADTTPLLANHRREIHEILERCIAVLITGGNVAVLLNRIRLFGVDELLRDKHIVAWSAGAMVLAKRIVLFHDRAPRGHRYPEILGAGCGLVPGHILLPDAAHRLRERNRLRVGLMCRRFSPDVCVALDSGAALRFRGTEIERAEAVRRLERDGRFARLRAG